MNKLVGIGAFAVSCCAPAALGVVDDPGFESYAVPDAGVLLDNSGPWTFVQNARVVDPFAPNTGSPDTYSATFAPHEGEQYASTYAGGDAITQPVFLQGGVDYTISVYAAAPDGDVTIPGAGTLALVDAGFEFIVDGFSLSAENVLAPGTDWTRFSIVVNASGSGVYEVGVRNTRIAPYFINYDSFTIVPGPGAGAAFLACGAFATTRRRRGC